MVCKLEQKDIGHYPGETYQTKPGTNCMQPTAIYFPRKRPAPGEMINVVLWLHGYYVHNLHYLLDGDRARIRDQVRDCGKDVALIAPFLGYMDQDKKGNWVGKYDYTNLAAANGGERYLNEMLAAIRDIGTTGNASLPPIRIKNLYVACHSAGGRAMRAVIRNLGQQESKLRGCWGLDCLYGEKTRKHPEFIEDAKFWYDWATEHKEQTLDIVMGGSTIHQSVKLELLARGIGTLEGNKQEPPGAALKNVRVTVGHYELLKLTGKDVRDLAPAFTDRYTLPHPADIAMMNRHGEFLDKMIANVQKSFPFAKDIHFMIARGAFLDRLKTL